MDSIFVKLYETDKPNANGHIYPKEVVRKALEAFQFEKIKTRRAFGVFKRGGYQVMTGEINMCDASHLITGYEEVPGGFMVTAKILDTPTGREAKTVLEANARFGMESVGELKDNTVTSMKLIAIDILENET